MLSVLQAKHEAVRDVFARSGPYALKEVTKRFPENLCSERHPVPLPKHVVRAMNIARLHIQCTS